MAFSVDVAVAVLILISALFLFTSMQKEPATSYSQGGAVVEDALFALDQNGFILQTLESENIGDKNTAMDYRAESIRNQILGFLGPGFDANVTVTSYDVNSDTCSKKKTFADCFSDSNKHIGYGLSNSNNFTGESTSGKKYYLKKDVGGTCDFNSSLVPLFSENEGPVFYFPEIKRPDLAFSEAFFAAPNIKLDVNVSPSGGSISCDQNIYVTLDASTSDINRLPVDVVLTMDRSTGALTAGERAAATAFISDANWDGSGATSTKGDQAGGVGYANLDPEPANKCVTEFVGNMNSLQNSFIDKLGVLGNCNVLNGNEISGGIRAANNILNPALSPAQKHGRPTSAKFILLLADGTDNEADANAAAYQSKALGARIFAIGFSSSANKGLLKGLTKITGGEYFDANDPNALSSLFLYIGSRIRVYASSTDSNVNVPLQGGMVLDKNTAICYPNPNTCDTNIMFNSGPITPWSPWHGTYTLNFPCDLAPVCNAQFFDIPGAQLIVKSGGTTYTYDFNKVRVNFKTRDLNISILGGRTLDPGEAELYVSVRNMRELDTNATSLKLYFNNDNSFTSASPILPSPTATVPPLCGSNDTHAYCGSESAWLYNAQISFPISDQTYIYATVNESNDPLGYQRECPPNISLVKCAGGGQLRVYVVEYTVWRA